MASPFTLPSTGFGLGSQPEAEGELQYMALPSGMRTYSAHLPEVEDTVAIATALAMLTEMASACSIATQGGPGRSLTLPPCHLWSAGPCLAGAALQLLRPTAP